MTKYPLSVVIQMRETAKDEAVAAYANAMNERQSAQARLDAAVAHDADLRAEQTSARQKRTEETDFTLLRSWSDYVDGLEVQICEHQSVIERAREELTQAEMNVKTARNDVATAEKELKAVEKHREKWQEEQRAAQAKKAADALDDLAIQRWSKS